MPAIYDLRDVALFLNCSVVDLVERLKSGRMSGEDYQKYLITAQAHWLIEAKRERDRQRGM